MSEWQGQVCPVGKVYPMVTVFGPAVIMEQNSIHLLLLAFWGGGGGGVVCVGLRWCDLCGGVSVHVLYCLCV